MNREHSPAAWYKEPSLWLLIAPLLLVFAVCAVLIGFALSSPDDRISDDYYKQGKLINKRFAAEQLAGKMGLVANVDLDFTSREVFLEMQGEGLTSDEITLYFSHPAEADKDFSIQLHQVRGKVFRSELPAVLTGRWYVRLEPRETSSNASWRLKGEVDLREDTASFRLE